MSDTPPPLLFSWSGDSFVPIPAHAKTCDEYYVIGEIYKLAQYEDRSRETHNHQFAWLKTAFDNLPEGIAHLYPSPEMLRKRALIEAGYYDEEAIDCGGITAALRVAGYARRKDTFALVIVRGPLVLIRTARSQSRKAMGAEAFQESKTAIMEIIADLVGVSIDQLDRMGNPKRKNR